MKSVKETIKRFNLIDNNEIIGCAVSGGSDSMALLHFLLQYQKECCFKIVCVNVEHGIRGSQSVCDSKFVYEFCQNNNIQTAFKSVNAIAYAKNNKCNLEQAARELRYGFFYSLIEEKICSKIFVAHNKNDNAETVFLNMLRGSGSYGLCGMEIDNKNGIIRPMLNTLKSEILSYINLNNILYVDDSTNNDNGYNRNFLRNCVFPIIEDRFDGFYENINNLSQILKEEKEYLDKKSAEHINFLKDGCSINLPCDTVLIKHAAFLCCKAMGINKDILSVNINDIVSLADRQNGSYICLSGGLKVFKEYGSLAFVFENKKINLDIKIPFKTGITIIGNHSITAECIKKEDFTEIVTDNENVYYADYDKMQGQCFFRFRQKGDSIKRYKGKRKSFSDYLTDLKIPLRQRDDILLVCKDDNVLIAFSCDISDDVKIDENTKTILTAKYRRIN